MSRRHGSIRLDVVADLLNQPKQLSAFRGAQLRNQREKVVSRERLAHRAEEYQKAGRRANPRRSRGSARVRDFTASMSGARVPPSTLVSLDQGQELACPVSTGSRRFDRWRQTSGRRTYAQKKSRSDCHNPGMLDRRDARQRRAWQHPSETPIASHGTGPADDCNLRTPAARSGPGRRSGTCSNFRRRDPSSMISCTTTLLQVCSIASRLLMFKAHADRIICVGPSAKSGNVDALMFHASGPTRRGLVWLTTGVRLE